MFGAIPMIYGTMLVSMIAISLAFPLGLGSAIFVSEFLRGKCRVVAKVGIELLAGIPSVLYGLLGVVYLREWLNNPLISLGGSSGDSLLTAGILLSVMILPSIMTFSDDALRCVPRNYRENAWGLGLSRTQTIITVVLPQARSGIMAATVLSLGRAIGETIAVYLVIGRADRPISESFTWTSFFEAGQTLTTKLGGSETAIAQGTVEHWGALMSLGLLLWCLVIVLTSSARILFRPLRENQ